MTFTHNPPTIATLISDEDPASTSLSLALPRPVTYDVVATLSAIQTAVAAEWTLLGTFTTTAPNFNTPAQVAVDSSGRVWIADTGNARAVRLTAAGAFDAQITGLTGITGVAVDSSGNVYVIASADGGLSYNVRKYNSSLVFQWEGNGIAKSSLPLRHVATDGTHVFAVFQNDNIRKYLCSTGAFVSTWGSAGSGNGQFTTPWGIAVDGPNDRVWVVDSGNNRVQRFDRNGNFVNTFAIPAGSRGIALDSTPNAWVAVNGSDQLRRYSFSGVLQETIAQADADGIAVASGDVLWASNAVSDTIAKWDESGGGWGELAIDIGGNLSPYTGIGERMGQVMACHSATVQGPNPITVRAFAKATSGTLTLQSLVLSATATPRSIAS